MSETQMKAKAGKRACAVCGGPVAADRNFCGSKACREKFHAETGDLNKLIRRFRPKK